jgi:hypothetical protein
MSASGRSGAIGRGSERLLWDCETVGRALANERDPARVRLEGEIGENVAQLLLATLREEEPSTPHAERVRRAAGDTAA